MIATRRAAAEAILRAMHEHSVEEPIERISLLIHPDAEMRLLVSYGQPIRGRTAATQALQNGREAATFHAQVERFEWLDDSTSLTTAQARYPLPGGGFGEGKVYWIDELRDGLIYRVRVFKREAQARRAYEDQRRDAADTTTPGVSDR